MPPAHQSIRPPPTTPVVRNCSRAARGEEDRADEERHPVGAGPDELEVTRETARRGSRPSRSRRAPRSRGSRSSPRRAPAQPTGRLRRRDREVGWPPMIRGRLRRHHTCRRRGGRAGANRDPVHRARAGTAERRLQRSRLAPERRPDVLAARRRHCSSSAASSGCSPLTQVISIPVIVAAIIATVGSPIVAWLHSHHVPRAAGAALLMLGIVAGRRADGLRRRRRDRRAGEQHLQAPLVGQGHDRRLAAGPRPRHRQGRQRQGSARQGRERQCLGADRRPDRAASASSRRSPSSWR